MLLVLAVQVEAHVAGQRCQGGQCPRRHRVGVDRDGQGGERADGLPVPQFAGHVGGEQVDLPGQPQYRLRPTR